MQEMQVWSLCWEEPLEKEMEIHSSILAWKKKSHGQRSLIGYSPWDCKRVGHDWATKQQQIINREFQYKFYFFILVDKDLTSICKLVWLFLWANFLGMETHDPGEYILFSILLSRKKPCTNIYSYPEYKEAFIFLKVKMLVTK